MTTVFDYQARTDPERVPIQYAYGTVTFAIWEGEMKENDTFQMEGDESSTTFRVGRVEMVSDTSRPTLVRLVEELYPRHGDVTVVLGRRQGTHRWVAFASKVPETRPS